MTDDDASEPAVLDTEKTATAIAARQFQRYLLSFHDTCAGLFLLFIIRDLFRSA